jgi:soluble lytic murein transglycosylase-like protein
MRNLMPALLLTWTVALSVAADVRPALAGDDVEGCAALLPHIERAAAAHDLEPALVAGVIHVESRFRNVVNRSSGARGYMQLMPATARRMGCGDLDDVGDNLACGARLLRDLLERYDGRLLLALSGYHAGLRMPNEARREARVPTNRSYLEKVLAARTRLIREGCP